MNLKFQNNSCLYLFDKNCYQGLSKHENAWGMFLIKGALIKRFVKNRKSDIILIIYDDWIKQDKRYLKHDYIKKRLKNIPIS